MYRRSLTTLSVLVIVCLGIAYASWRMAGENGTAYRNSINGYELRYPSNLSVREYGADDAVFGHEHGDVMDGVAEARVLTVQGEAGQSVQDAVAEQLKSLCAADGPGASFSCSRTASILPFVTNAGDEGFVIALEGELRNLQDDTSISIPKGPYYALVLATSASISKVLVVHPPLNLSTAEADTVSIQSIAQSVTRAR